MEMNIRYCSVQSQLLDLLHLTPACDKTESESLAISFISTQLQDILEKRKDEVKARHDELKKELGSERETVSRLGLQQKIAKEACFPDRSV